MRTIQEIMDSLERWESVKKAILLCGRPWFLEPVESAVLWQLRQDAIDADVPYSVIGRISRLFDRH